MTTTPPGPHGEIDPVAATRMQAGNPERFDRMFEAAYADLKGLAHRRLRSERADLTLGTTALVHEVYLRLLGNSRLEWRDRHHFFAVMARTMRHILVDQARERFALKRGGDRTRVTFAPEALAELLDSDGPDPDAILALDEQLKRLEAAYPRRALAVELRYFGGLTLNEVGQTLGSSAPTAMRDIRFALAWLADALCSDD